MVTDLIKVFGNLAGLLVDTVCKAPSRIAELLFRLRHERQAVIARTARVTANGWIDNGRNRHDIFLGENSVLRGQLFVYPHGGSISIGSWCFVGEGSRIWSSNSIVIGDRTLISHNVDIHDNNGHSVDHAIRHQHFVEIVSSGHPHDDLDIRSGPVLIGNDVWVGFGATILKGVTVGDGAIISAHSVVVSDVAAWTMVAGNPARVVRRIQREIA